MSAAAEREIDLTIILPAFNEAAAVAQVLNVTRQAMATWHDV
jgi:hypothetical protein